MTDGAESVARPIIGAEGLMVAFKTTIEAFLFKYFVVGGVATAIDNETDVVGPMTI